MSNSFNRGSMICSAVPGTLVRLKGRKFRNRNYTVGTRIGQMVICIDPDGNIVHVGANAEYKPIVKLSTIQ